ncbi:phosphoribosylanthranilate isomerase [Bacillus mesophilum]|uniref:N-(5'-phosphoribosyl)anthranilate isomerase n=1 Tax=Bacillus mesophilum TaxID=1071718 RepID=A0A7V7RMF4_9BACI|nr:phosphoribosylanthranilate isomerase [Bacillus mesophilum]KAB2333485.1 phosphoribosylanthranilate isomerase [Bacillus mesophilum]
MKVKICGITDLNTAQAAINNGADAVGFVFAESKRQITAEQASSIIKNLPESVLKVGVFVNATREKIEAIIQQTGINVVQLHGDESPEDCLYYEVPVIKSFSIESRSNLNTLALYQCDFYLLDSPKGKYRGGNGTSFNWKITKTLNKDGKKIILAGGLNALNVAEAINIVDPYMVDVSSGVETEGVKDADKIKEFMLHANGMKEEANK